jgi:hypothetical protein
VTTLALFPVVLSLLLLAAHFLRAGVVVFVLLVLAVLGLLAVRRPWAARVVQVVLVLGALDWVRLLIDLTRERLAMGQPVVRLVIILGSVVLLTLGSALAFRTERMRKAYGLGGRGAETRGG